LYPNCKICGARSEPVFKAKVLNKYLVDYYFCDECGFLQTQKPFWLSEAYRQVINDSDCGILSRNLEYRRISSTVLFFLFGRARQFLDYGGGYGIFTRLMRDVGFDFYWHDKYACNLISKGFEWPEGMWDIELVTAFELIEHLEYPLLELEKIFIISRNILFSTFLLPDPVPHANDWWYYNPHHGQHISFYSLKTLGFIAKKYRLYLHSNKRDLHLFTTKYINPVVFGWIVRLSKYGLFWIVKKFMRTKIVRDEKYLVARNQ